MTRPAWMPVKMLNEALEDLRSIRAQIALNGDEPTAHRLWEIEGVVLEALPGVEGVAVTLEDLYEAHGATDTATMPCGVCLRTRALIARDLMCSTPGCEFPPHDPSAHPCGKRAE